MDKARPQEIIDRAELQRIFEKHELAIHYEIGGEFADLSGADLTGLSLCGTDLRSINFREANLSGVNLTGVDLRHADLRGANLRGARLLFCNFSRADLSGADFRGANLRDINLSEADVTGANIAQVTFSRWTMTVTPTHIQIGCEQLERDGHESEYLAALADKYSCPELLESYQQMYMAIATIIPAEKEQ